VAVLIRSHWRPPQQPYVAVTVQRSVVTVLVLLVLQLTEHYPSILAHHLPCKNAAMLKRKVDKAMRCAYPTMFDFETTRMKFSQDIHPAFPDMDFPHLDPIAMAMLLLTDASVSGTTSQHLDFNQIWTSELSGSGYQCFMQQQLNKRVGETALMVTLCFFIDKVRVLWV
jgi:hypothetical protein